MNEKPELEFIETNVSENAYLAGTFKVLKSGVFIDHTKKEYFFDKDDVVSINALGVYIYKPNKEKDLESDLFNE